MKLSDLVFNLAYRLPRHTDKFSNIQTYTSIVAVNGLVTVTTPSPHGMSTGAYITAHNFMVKRNVVSLTQEDGVATAIVDSDHDLTDGWQETVKIEGANQSVYNGTHEFIHQPNRRTFQFSIDPDAPASATGTIKFVEYLELGFDGAYPITVTSPTTFTFQLPDATFNFTGFEGILSRGQRVIGAPDIERFLQLYERYPKDSYYAVVCMDDAITSKDRTMMNDSIAQLSGSMDFRQKLIEPFSVYVVAPVTEEMTAVQAIDNMYEEIRNAILKTIMGLRLPSGLSDDAYSGVVFAAHGMYAYDKAWYIHQYRFETMKEISVDDSFYSDPTAWPTRAFRDIALDLHNSFNETVMETNINLDQEPL